MRDPVMNLSMLGALAVLLGTAAGCGDDGKGGAGAADYALVSEILGGPEQGSSIGSCAAGSCHGGESAGQAHLNFKKAPDLATALVNVTACENNAMKLVVPGDPENSWLWIKLTAEIEDTTSGKLIHAGTPSACAGVSTGFGSRMPYVAGLFTKLPDDKLAVIHDWIAGGAPGPDE